MPYEDMERNVASARIVITHGGPASFVMPLRIGKIPIVVPRQYQYGEHVNDHQVDFVKAVVERMNTIIPVFEIGELVEKLKKYDEIVASMPSGMNSNNVEFNRRLEEMVEGMGIR